MRFALTLDVFRILSGLSEHIITENVQCSSSSLTQHSALWPQLDFDQIIVGFRLDYGRDITVGSHARHSRITTTFHSRSIAAVIMPDHDERDDTNNRLSSEIRL